jgi:glycosyltransferase involved in cell wall biosynthesis
MPDVATGSPLSTNLPVRAGVRLVYLANAQIPSRSTNGLQIMRMCEGFRRSGVDVTLVHPYRLGNRPEGYDGDVWAFYGIKDRFRRVTLPTPLNWRLSTMPWISRPVIGLPLSAYLAWRCRPGAAPFACYTRSLLGAWLALRARRLWGPKSACRGIFIELHDRPQQGRDWIVLEQTDGVIAISAALRDYLIDTKPELEQHTWIEHDGVDLELVADSPIHPFEARRHLGLPVEGFLVVYTGRVNEEKGAGVMLDAAELLRDRAVHFLLVGKVYGEALNRRAADLENVTMTGFVRPSRVPTYLAAADVLVLPSTDELPYAAFTSPLKLFEYMAARRPIVASDLPVFHEVIRDGDNALLYPRANPAALAQAVQRLAEDPELRSSLGDRSHQDAQMYTWERRAARILGRLHAAAR